MNNLLNIIIRIILFLLIGLIGIGQSDDLESNILQYNTGRFYFRYGVESNVFKNCSFDIYDESGSIYSGYIENALPGISYSYPSSVNYDTLFTNSLKAFIKIADIDRLSKLTIGIIEGDKINYFASMPISGGTENGNIIEIRKFDSYFEMILAMENNEIDCIVSYKNLKIQNKITETYSAEAMYYVAMIPDIESSVNTNGLLTKSLYYRFDTELFGIYYEGDGLKSFYNLYPKSDSAQRYYDYNPGRGKTVLRSLDLSGKKIGVVPIFGSLDRLSDYFNDILARDRIVISSDTGQIILTYIPIDPENPGNSLDSIYNILLRAAPMESGLEKSLAVIESYIDYGHSFENFVKQEYYFDKAQKNLIEDFGVFPLYRPTIYFIFSERTKGFDLKPNGWLDLSELKIIQLPQKPGSVSP